MGPIGILESPHLYRLWQLPFWPAKFAPVARHHDLTRIERGFDVRSAAAAEQRTIGWAPLPFGSSLLALGRPKSGTGTERH